MFLMSGITDDSKQVMTINLPNGETAQMTLYFVPMQYGWYISELIYQDFTARGIRITNNPNILQQFKNLIPFGLACYTEENREPTQQEDFSSESSKLFILSEEEVDEYQEVLSGG